MLFNQDHALLFKRDLCAGKNVYSLSSQTEYSHSHTHTSEIANIWVQSIMFGNAYIQCQCNQDMIIKCCNVLLTGRGEAWFDSRVFITFSHLNL